MTVPTVALQMKFSGIAGAWTDVAADVLTNPGISLQYGIMGNGPNDRVAATGTLNFSLNNSISNSGGKLGYYSPGNANCRSGFELGINTRLALTYSGSTFYKFTGRLDIIDPLPGTYMSRQTLCTAVDWMDEAARHPLNKIPLQVSVRADQIISTVIGNMTRTPSASTLSTAQQEYPYALDTAFDESTTVLTEFQRVAQTDRGVIVIRGDQTQGGVLTFYDRRARMNGYSNGLQPLAASTILQTNMVRMHTPRPRAQVWNRVYTTVHPRMIGMDSTSPVYAMTGCPHIDAGSSLTLEGGYTHPLLRSTRIGAACMIIPVANTDYSFGPGPGGYDTSGTGDLSIAGSFGANTGQLIITNNGSVGGQLSFLQSRGLAIMDFAPVVNQKSDTTSINAYGQARLFLDLPYEYTAGAGSGIGEYELSTWKTPRYAPDAVSFVGTGTACLLDAGLRREPGDVIGITEPVVGLSASEFYIQAVTVKISGKNVAEFTWLLQDRVDFTDYWVLNVDKLAETSADSGSAWSVLGL